MTTRTRSENLQKVLIAITAFTPEALAIYPRLIANISAPVFGGGSNGRIVAAKWVTVSLSAVPPYFGTSSATRSTSK